MQTTTAANLKKNDFVAIEKSVGFNAKEIINCPPIAMLKQVDGVKEKLEAFLAIQIVKLSETVNVNSNLNIQNYQIPTIAAQLIENYPVESLEDFVLCFKRGGAGFYGTIYKLDASVLCEWMKAYLDEKYTIVESKVKEEQSKNIEENSVNYEEFKKRAGEMLVKEKVNNFKENEYQKMKLQNPYAWYSIEGFGPKIYATSQDHANLLFRKMIDNGEIERVD